MDKKISFLDNGWRIILILYSLLIVFPILWIFCKSLQTNREFFQNAWSLPSKLQWSNYIKAWNNLGIGSAMLNTVYYVGASLVLGLLLSTAAAYVLTRLEFRGRKFIIAIVMLSLFLPGINAMVPLYVVMRSLHLINSLTGLVIFNSIGGNAFALLLLSGFMQSIPKEIEESANIDGASLFQTFRRIIVPLSVPGIITLAIFNFIALYNDFIIPFIFLDDPAKYTIGVNMYTANTLMQFKADWVTLCAGVMVAMAPPIIMYVIFQKQVMEGATLGSMKG